MFEHRAVDGYSKMFTVMLNTDIDDGDDLKSCSIRIIINNHEFTISNIYPFIKPWNRDGYFEPRRYGITIFENFVNISYGIICGDSKYDQKLGWTLPWTEWLLVRLSIYNSDGSIHWTGGISEFKDRKLSGYSDNSDGCEYVYFSFDDIDGVENIATCYTEEREWTKGTGIAKWLKYFTKNKTYLRLDASFYYGISAQKNKCSGGTIGTGAEINTGETSSDTFHREIEGRYTLSNVKMISSEDALMWKDMQKLSKL